jgi:hypothetical protein
MNLEGAVGALWLVVHWRVSLCLVASLLAAYLFVQTVPWITGLQGVAVVALGVAAGIAWEGRRASSKNARPLLSSRFGALGLTVITGAAWGLFSSTSRESVVAGAVLLFVGAGLWPWYVSRNSPAARSRLIAYCAGCAVLSFPLGVFLGRYAL